jgi:transmembrane sensor
MSEPPTPNHSLSETATDWCIRLHLEDCSEADRKAFQRWYHADPAHAAEYEAVFRIWSLSAQLPGGARAPGDLGALTPPTASATPRRRSVGRLLARAAMVTLAAGVCWAVGWSAGMLPGNARYFVAQDARRQVVLPDESRVELNLRTSLLYLSYNDQRRVLLSDGEAYFEVQRNLQKPFVIRTENAKVRVTGTHFNIWTAPERTMVTVSEGSVLASRVIAGVDYDQAVELTAGMRGVFGPDRGPQLARVDPVNAMAWRNGKLMLDSINLRDALPLINRYLTRPLFLADSRAGELRIGGIYDTAELDKLVGALPRILPLNLRQLDSATLVSSRPGAF